MRAGFPQGRAWIELDRAALRHNVQQLRSILPEGCALMPAIKANAYGHGAVLIAKELNRLGITAFCVATVTEGAELRRGGIGLKATEKSPSCLSGMRMVFPALCPAERAGS